ncbi:Monoterpene epsilon-lactone hydrolase [Hypsizygus marmoreus]|uniref:Monoterpene epsilon-lactone hydrolase n=1 Tax=Hypsizygus marmoreus TaxID=39966 RepID=A0A369JCV9_HYPMA|nr:Monoterpene epsilon-lactone hydrolase [Hypsizygus marmoreus]
MPHNTRPYAHHAHLPYSHEPLKSLYVFQRLFTTLALVPYWVLYYSLLPRRCRPRESWSLRQIINVNFTRRIFKITEVAGVTWGTRDPNSEPSQTELKETRFQWVDPLPEDLRTGIVAGDVPFTKVGCYIWPKDVPPEVQLPLVDIDCAVDLEATAAGVPLIGVFMHGGGYCHMSAHETARTSKIPRRLIRDKILTEVYSVEYRLLQHAPFPAVVQDAAAVYTHVVKQFREDGLNCKIILIGDSSGGNLVLALARWIRDEGKLPLPDGLILLSPSCDTSHCIPETLSAHIPRPNASTDYLVDTPESRALLHRTFLGFKHNPPLTMEEELRLMKVVHSEYVSPCSPRVLKRWAHPVKQDAEGIFEEAFHEELINQEFCPTHDIVIDIDAQSDAEDPEFNLRGSTGTRFSKLFEEFPRSLIVVGDAERLVKEVKSLQGAMEQDGVDVRTVWIPDAAHDVLIIGEGWWDQKAVEGAWSAIKEWVGGF